MTQERDTFFDPSDCDRCGNDTSTGFTMSWFTEEKICNVCKKAEDKIKAKLFVGGLFYEGCGYIPNPKEELVTPKL